MLLHLLTLYGKIQELNLLISGEFLILESINSCRDLLMLLPLFGKGILLRLYRGDNAVYVRN